MLPVSLIKEANRELGAHHARVVYSNRQTAANTKPQSLATPRRLESSQLTAKNYAKELNSFRSSSQLVGCCR
ncbi:MAG: hypothetical protein SFU25_11325 [Candidatus Caenarcaniphilales bacterium]|nr:hypothetical protein [Candidatus Caenarcaniphilales bacterium]